MSDFSHAPTTGLRDPETYLATLGVLLADRRRQFDASQAPMYIDVLPTFGTVDVQSCFA